MESGNIFRTKRQQLEPNLYCIKRSSDCAEVRVVRECTPGNERKKTYRAMAPETDPANSDSSGVTRDPFRRWSSRAIRLLKLR